MHHPETIDIHSLVLVDATQTPDWAFPLHTHDHHLEISLVLDGGGTFYCEGRSYAMRKGDLTVKNAGVVHAEHTSRERPIRQVCISFSGVHERADAPNCLLPPAMPPVFAAGADEPLLAAAFTYLAAHWQGEEDAAACRAVMLAALEVISLRIQSMQGARVQPQPDQRAAQAVAEATAWINENYAQKITLKGLSERFYISPFYLEKKFKESTGYSVNQYVIDRRMGEAQRLLIFEDMSIKEVAAAVGYENLQYFYATFKKYAGKAPAVFRAEYR